MAGDARRAGDIARHQALVDVLRFMADQPTPRPLSPESRTL